MPREEASPEELAAGRDARIAAQQLDRHERYLAALRLAIRIREDSHFPIGAHRQLLESGEDEREALFQKAGGRIVGRKRPKQSSNRPMTVYIDECGQHMLTAKAEFHAFVLAAVLIPDDAYPRIDSTWKRWKAAVLGSADKRLHEPDVRKGRGPFFLQGDRARRERAVVALARRLEKTEMRAFACVMHRPEYLEQFGPVPLDSSLPSHPYLMTLHFLAERIVMAMQQEFGGGRAHFIAESRGPLEDAKMQYEFTRLLLDGTSYVSAAWFREYLAPGIEFRDKQANLTGLQLADLLARPCGEKILRPESTPARWPQFRTKLCQGQETANSILGLKIVPWDEKYAGVWLS